ncbi:MAG: RagB/SusD family nutrient uptake outer membrane protein, partial [Bacteroidota bacterium]
MKNNFNVIILGFLLTLIMVSCENFLDTKPINFLTPPVAYNTEEQLEASLAGVYDALGGVNSTKGIYSDAMITYGAIEGDLTFYASTNPTDGPQIYDFSRSNRFVEYYWSALYLGIDRANMLLANIDNNPDIDDEVRSVISGEANFLRGYYYFLLVQTFGGVPLKLEPSVSASHADDIAKSSIKEVYSQILSDMKKSEPLVMGIGDVKFGGRVNKSAVR